MKKKLITFLLFLGGAYCFLICLIFFFQEKLLFLPEKLDPDFQFKFKNTFEELYIKVSDDINLHGLLFKADSTKGIIFYLHGNGGSVRGWSRGSNSFTDLGYDLFMLDYRGYGKSEGTISSQEQLYSDNQEVYNYFKTKYDEQNIIVLGYSIGSGMAAKLVSQNKPKQLILQAPYYSLTDLVDNILPFIPSFLLNYKFTTNEYLKDCNIPITIFHGDKDEVIYYGSSIKLKEEFKEKINLITLAGQKHNGMIFNEDYKKALKTILD